MLNKFLKDAVSIVAGRSSENIVDFLDSKKYVNEWLIAKKLDLTINQVRNILYKLSDHGLVSSIRKKDKRKGWYTYFWKIESVKSLEFLKKNIERKLSQTSNQVGSREVNTFYICENCNIEHNEENALLHDFTCNECGRILTVKDNTKLLKELKKNVDKQKKEIELIDEELNKEKEVIEKKKSKDLKRELKATKKKTAMKREARKEAKKLTTKKTEKKKLVKKPVKKKTKKTVKKTPKKTKQTKKKRL